MGLESATFINGLVATNPAAGDARSEGDDHIRLLKSVLLATFPAINAAVNASDEEINYLVGVTSAIQTQLNAKAAASHAHSAADITAGTLAIANGGTGAATAVDAFTALKQAATETTTGVVELATQAEAVAGASDAVVMTPLKTAQAITALGASVGVGQTWQDVKASRAVAITYTNTTGKPIQVGAIIASSVANILISCSVDSVITGGFYQPSGVSGQFVSTIVPNGSTYRIDVASGTPTVLYWAELR